MDVTFEDIVYIGRWDFELPGDRREGQCVVTECFDDEKISCIGNSAIFIYEVKTINFLSIYYQKTIRKLSKNYQIIVISLFDFYCNVFYFPIYCGNADFF